MRELTNIELTQVAGGAGHCTVESADNAYWGVTNVSGIGRDLINFYEGLVGATSHVIERVANAF